MGRQAGPTPRFPISIPCHLSCSFFLPRQRNKIIFQTLAMANHLVGWVATQKQWLLTFLVMLSASTVIIFFIRAIDNS
ncbi:hypothetical protein DVH24_001716 [Malus domestica]|uniref:Uncharacterized protein n=1 Tax=Malus domestica TaxID=3750 RepID=A0A498I307_MALDO|nr:hypothetical protein DVH24_001716 [Malus domestica]